MMRKLAVLIALFASQTIVVETPAADPSFCQCDSAWGTKKLGTSNLTMCAYGCATCAMASLLSAETSVAENPPVDPGRLCDWLSANGGYTSGGLIYWGRAADYDGSQGLKYVVAADTSVLVTLDNELSRGNRAVVKVDATPSSTGGITEHWVAVHRLSGPAGTASSYTISDSLSCGAPETLAKYLRPDGKFVFAVRSFSGTWSAPANDPFEIDNTLATSKTITVNAAAQTHNINPATDQDWVKFTTTSARNIRITTNGPSGGDSYLRFYNSAGTLIASDDDAGTGLYSIVSSPARPAGTYYIQVTSFNNASTITGYTLTVSYY